MNGISAAAIALTAALGVSTAGQAAIAIGDSLNFYLGYSSAGVAYPYVPVDTFTYTGAGQTETIICNCGRPVDVGSVILYGDRIEFIPAARILYPDAAFAGPVVQDLSNAAAFAGWRVLKDDLGAVGFVITGDTLGVNLTNLAFTAHSGEAVIGAPEPSAWAMMLVGLGAMGAALRARRRAGIATSFQAERN